MSYYTISSGKYSEHYPIILSYPTQLTNKKFTKMYNKAIKELGGVVNYDDIPNLANKMVDMFGFKIVVSQFEINSGYGNHTKIEDLDNLEDIGYYVNDSTTKWKHISMKEQD